MRRKRHIYSVAISILFLNLLVVAQDPVFTQFLSTPSYLNPAFSGNYSEHRFAANYRNQWPGIKKSFVSYLVTYDYALSKYNSGLGIFVLQDKAGTSKLTNTRFGFNYNYALRLNEQMHLRLGLQASMNQKKYDLGALTFSDQFITGTTSLDAQNNTAPVNYFDVGTGALLDAKKFWIAASALHINQPSVNLWGAADKLPMFISVSGGYKYEIAKAEDATEAHHYVSALFHYRHQSVSDQLDIGASYFIKMINFTVWYRGIPFKKYKSGYSNNESVAFVLAYAPMNKGYKIGYSYDLTISSLGLATTMGSHEISLVYEFGKKGVSVRKARQSIGGSTKF